MTHILGLDFGGTKLAAGLYSIRAGDLIGRMQVETPVAGGAPASLAAMLGMARALIAEHPVHLRSVGVSFGGPVSPDGRTIRLSMHVPGWEKAALADWLERDLGAPTRIANDADAAALAEYHLGAGQHVSNMLYVTVSTGIGGGIICGGQLYRGERGWAGEVGHMLLVPDGPPCPCGRNGCLESLSSGLSIARDARQALLSGEPSALREIPAEQLSAKHVAEAAAAGDPLAQRVWSQAMAWIGYGLASASNLLNPGRIVIGGGLTRAGGLLFDPVRAIVSQRCMDPALQVVPARLADNVGLLGGVSLWLGPST
jgi:glucokinase